MTSFLRSGLRLAGFMRLDRTDDLLLGDRLFLIRAIFLSFQITRSVRIYAGSFFGETVKVTLNVLARKVRADNIGRETPTPMNDLVEVGVFDKDKNEPIYVARHRIQSGQQTIRTVVSREPGRASVDPNKKLSETERGANAVDVVLLLK